MQNHKTRVAIIGASGWIGRHLAMSLQSAGCEVIGVGRSQPDALAQGVACWQSMAALDLCGVQAVVNLAGERIDRRWTSRNRDLFRESRIGVTERLVAHLAGLPEGLRPGVLVNASAVGIYGNCGDRELDETSPVGHGYLAELCRDWERSAQMAGEIGIRVSTARIGVVLGRGGPAFETLRRVFMCGFGGRLGNGRQWMPWIHMEDLVAALTLLATGDIAAGPVNLVSPEPVTNRDFTKRFAAACERPAMFPVPAPMLHLALGGFASALLSSQRVLPGVLLRQQFHFRYPGLDEALAELLGG